MSDLFVKCAKWAQVHVDLFFNLMMYVVRYLDEFTILQISLSPG